MTDCTQSVKKNKHRNKQPAGIKNEWRKAVMSITLWKINYISRRGFRWPVSEYKDKLAHKQYRNQPQRCLVVFSFPTRKQHRIIYFFLNCAGICSVLALVCRMSRHRCRRRSCPPWLRCRVHDHSRQSTITHMQISETEADCFTLSPK